MTRTLAVIGLFLAFASVIGLVLGDDGMAACQSHQNSFDVCHDAIH